VYKQLWISIGIPLIIAITSLVLEYHTGLFQSENSKEPASRTVLYILAASWLCVLLLIKQAISIGVRASQNIRETFSFFAGLAILFGALSTTAAWITGVLPWQLGHLYAESIIGKSLGISPPRWTDYGFLISIYLGSCALLIWQHRTWRGSISAAQHRRVEDGDAPSLFFEFVGEVRRVFKQGPPLEIYRGTEKTDFLAPLETTVDTSVWSERARELVLLSSSAYQFDSRDDWHPGVGCWVGNDVQLDSTVCLFPITSAAEAAHIKTVFDYAERIARRRKKKLSRVLVALERGNDSEVPRPDPRISIATEDSLLDELVDFRDYENEIRRRVMSNHLPDSTVTINNAYVAPRVEIVGNDVPHEDLEAFLLQWLEDSDSRQLALLGEYGQGKSTSALMFTYRTLFSPSKHGRIPLLVELRGMSPGNLSPLQLLGAWASRYRIAPQALLHLIRAGRIILIFEGFDEMSLVGDAEMRIQHFRTLWQFCYPRSKLLITGRPNFFLDEEEMKAALGISKPRTGQPYCQAVRLVPFGLPQIENSLRAQKRVVREQISQLARKNQRFFELVSRPSLLHIVSVLWEREKLSEKVDQLNSAFVMELFVRHSYRRLGRHPGDASVALTTSEREFFMVGIAAYMAARQLPNQISARQLNMAIECLTREIPDEVTTHSTAMTGEVREPLRSRIKGSKHALETVKTDVRACGLLVDDPATPGTFRFGHKSFMEYLTASVVADLLLQTSPSTAKAVLRAVNLELKDLLPLSVTIDFLAEMLQTADAKSSKFVTTPTGDVSRERAFALRLFQFLAGTKLRAKIQRIILFDAAYTRSLKALPTPVRFVLWWFSPIRISAALPLLAVVFSPLVFQSAVDPTGFDSRLLPVVAYRTVFFGAALIAYLQGAILISWSRSSRSMNRFRLWNVLCLKVGVGAPVLHRLAGTWLLPWVQKDEFNYFVRGMPSLIEEIVYSDTVEAMYTPADPVTNEDRSTHLGTEGVP
jgi:hypothetical protein